MAISACLQVLNRKYDEVRQPEEIKFRMAIDFQQFSNIQEELRNGLDLFGKNAAFILADSGVELVIPKRDDIRLEDHFFSLLFLYAYLSIC
jgi:hypothetical protein